MQLTPHFTLEELTASDTAARRGLDNTPQPAIVENLHALAEVLEQVRAALDRPMLISSGYRSPKVNTAVGSKPTSMHIQGLAADFICPQFGTPLEVAEEIAAAGIRFDQLIHEFGRWVHIGIRLPDEPWRGQLLTIDARGTRTGLQRV